MGEFGSWVFWKRDPVFVLIFHPWENFCHWQFKGRAANIMSICCCAGIHDFIESESREAAVGRGVSGGGGRKIVTYFCFKCVSVHIWSLFRPIHWESRRRPMTCLLRLTWFWLSQSESWMTPCPPEVQGSPPESSKLTQCVKAGMTPCSVELSGETFSCFPPSWR